MGMNKTLTNLLKAVCLKRAEGCGDCGGSGGLPVTYPSKCKPQDGFDRPCPTCAKWREKAEKYCWHEWAELNLMPKLSKCSCGKKFRLFEHDYFEDGRVAGQWPYPRCAEIKGNNPTYTIISIREALEDIEEFDNFIFWLVNVPPHIKLSRGLIRRLVDVFSEHKNGVPEKLLKFVCTYLEGVKCER
jgi:hypothetical protein